MPAGERYRVVLDLRKMGDFGLEPATRHADTLDRRLHGLKGGLSELQRGGVALGGAFDWAAGRAVSLAKWTGAIGGAAVFAGLTYGVRSLNAEIEKTQVALATIMSVQGFAPDVAGGLAPAAKLIKEMRVDARLLPGEFEDLRNIFLTGAVPAFRSGLDPEKWRELASKVMAAGVVSSLPLDQVAREMGLLLEGRSGSHNVLGLRLMGLSGDRAQEFNKLSGEKRVERLSAELDKFAGSIDVFSKTYEAASSTFVDNFKTVALRVTEPLFHGIVDSLNDANHWFDANQQQIDIWAEAIGERIGDAFDYGRETIEEWGPLVLDFADAAESRLESLWETLKPFAETFRDVMHDALADPNGTIDKLTTLAEALLVLKGLSLGVAFSGALGGGLGKGAGALGMARGAVIGGGLAALIPALLEAQSQVDMDRKIGKKGAWYGRPLGDELIPEWFGPRGSKQRETFDAMSLDSIGRWGRGPEGLFGDAPKPFVDQYQPGLNQTIPRFAEYAAEAEELVDQMYENNLTLGEMKHALAEASDGIRARFGEASAAAFDLAASTKMAAEELENMGVRANRMMDFFMSRPDNWEDNRFRDLADWSVRNAKDPAKKDTVKPKGGGGTHIQKVEIVVTANDSPSRVARLIFGAINREARNRTHSPYTPNYGSQEG